MAGKGFFDQLPDDILDSILLSLPFGSILRCRILSRSLNNFILSPRFIDHHLNKSKISANSQPLFLGLNYINDIFPDNYCARIGLIEHRFISRLAIQMPGVHLLCYCDGMFLMISDKENKFILWNPSLMRHNMVFHSRYEYTGFFGLCRHHMNNSEFYIVVGRDSRYSFYSSRTKSWTARRYDQSGVVANSAGLSVDGAVYWERVTKVENVEIQNIVCFDSRDEVLRILEKPGVLGDTDRVHLVSCNDRLCGWFNNVKMSKVETWRLNSEGGWEEFMMIHQVPNEFGSIKPLFFLDQNMIILHVEGIRLVYYSLTTMTFWNFLDTATLIKNNTIIQMFPYVDSLVFFNTLRTQPSREGKRKR